MARVGPQRHKKKTYVVEFVYRVCALSQMARWNVRSVSYK